MRPSSGVTPLTIFTKPWSCGGNCLFCPAVPELPKSYLPHSDVRKKGLSHDAAEQLRHWISFAESRGAAAKKLEVVVLGGSFTAHPLEYQREFLRGIYVAADGVEDDGLSLEECVENHAAPQYGAPESGAGCGRRIIGITVETRPDLVTREAIAELFAAGVTKIELGVQSLDDEALEFNERGHGADATARATELIRSFGIKVGYHILLGMPGASVESDFKSMMSVFDDPAHRPDHLKIYFCEMFRREFMRDRLVQMHDTGQWRPMSLADRNELLGRILPRVPEFMRISRIGRQTKENEVEGARVRTTNVEEEIGCRCVRCREPRPSDKVVSGFVIREICVSDSEIYLEANPDHESGSTLDQNVCLGVLRLHLDKSAATVRELHVYGEETSLGQTGRHQHRGVGRALMKHAEAVARSRGIAAIRVASGVGVRRYYEKMGYALTEMGMMERRLDREDI